MKLFAFIALAAGIFSAQTALADTVNSVGQQPWNKHMGWYAEVNGGPNLYAGVMISDHNTASSAGFQGGGWSTDLGYNFTPVFSLEGGFMQNYATFELFGEDVPAHTNLPYVAARWTVPIADKFAFIAKLGGMYGWLASNDSDGSTPGILLPYTGIGVSYALTPQLDISAQYQGAIYGIANAGLLSAGLTYHFSKI